MRKKPPPRKKWKYNEEVEVEGMFIRVFQEDGFIASIEVEDEQGLLLGLSICEEVPDRKISSMVETLMKAMRDLANRD